MPDDARTDEQLIETINQGGQDASRAFDALYLRYRDWVTTLAFRFVGNRDLALDVLQETFMYVLRKFPGFVLSAQFKTFLYPVVKHLAIAARNKAARFHNPADAEGNDAISAVAETAGATNESAIFAALPTDATPDGKRRGDLAIVLRDLSEDHRETVLLRFVDDFTMDEIAETMGVPPGTVKSRLHHALKKLRDDPRVREYFEP